MKAIDMHSHYSTKRAYLWRTPEEVAIAENKFRFKAVYKTEEEMAQELRAANVRGIFDLGFTTEIPLMKPRKCMTMPLNLKRIILTYFLADGFLLTLGKGLKLYEN